MVRTLLTALALLAPLNALAADAIIFADVPAQNRYVRIWTSSTAAVADEMTEGSSAGVGRYVIADSALVTAGLSTAGVYQYKIFDGATASTTANHTCVGVGTLYWTGSAAISEANYLLYGTTSDTGASTWGRALHYLRNAWVSSGVYSTGSLANAPSGGGGGSIDEEDADLIAARINAARGQHYPNRANVWVLQRTSSGVAVKDDVELSKNPTEVFKAWIDFSGVVGRNEFIQEINSLTIDGGDVTEVADSEGISGNLVYAKYEGGTDEDVCTITYDVDTTAGQQLTGTVTLNVAE